jgi:hypothetical protein
MNVNEKKSGIIDKIKLYMTMANSDINLRSFESYISEQNDPLNFLLIIYKTIEGDNALETFTEYLLSKVITQEYLDKLSNKFYNKITRKIPENIKVPTQYSNPGMAMSISSFDLTNSFKKPVPSTSTSFNTNQLFRDIQDKVLTTAGQEVPLGVQLPGVPLAVSMKYNDATGEILTKLPAISAKEIFVALTVYIGPLFSSKVIINEIINLLFHTDFTEEDAKIIIMTRSYAKYESKNVFKLDLNKLLNLQLDTETKGLNVDASCYRENIAVTREQIDLVANNPTVSNFKALIPEYNTETSSNVVNDYYVKIFEAIGDALLAMFIKQPGVMFFINLYNKIMNIDFDFKRDIESLFVNLGDFIGDLWDDIYEDFLCIVLEFIKKILLRLVIIVTIKLIREQLKKRQDILLSLSGARFV